MLGSKTIFVNINEGSRAPARHEKEVTRKEKNSKKKMRKVN